MVTREVLRERLSERHLQPLVEHRLVVLHHAAANHQHRRAPQHRRVHPLFSPLLPLLRVDRRVQRAPELCARQQQPASRQRRRPEPEQLAPPRVARAPRPHHLQQPEEVVARPQLAEALATQRAARELPQVAEHVDELELGPAQRRQRDEVAVVGGLRPRSGGRLRARSRLVGGRRFLARLAAVGGQHTDLGRR